MATHGEGDAIGVRSGPGAPASTSPLMLARLIEGEIIPRLLLAHRGEVPVVRPASSDGVIAPGAAEAFVHDVLVLEVHSLLAHTDRLLARGVSVETIYLDLLAPTARALGAQWERDECDFVDVTMGLWRLQQLVHELASRMPVPLPGNVQRRALFTVIPGDQHSFGLVMIEEFFRRAGWQTWSAPTASTAELLALVERQWFEMIGFTVMCEDQLDALPALLLALRRSSRNPSLRVMVGGHVFTARPELATRLGADATAADGRQAVATAEMLLDLLATRAPATAAGHG